MFRKWSTMLAAATAIPMVAASAQWHVGVSVNTYSYGSLSEPFLQSADNPEVFRRVSPSVSPAAYALSVMRTISPRLDAGVELSTASLAFGLTTFDRTSDEIVPSLDHGEGRQFTGVVRLRYLISDLDWKLRIETVAGAGLIRQTGFLTVDPDARNSLTRPLGQLGIALVYPITGRMDLRVGKSWLFHKTASDRVGIPDADLVMRDSRLSVGFEFQP